MLKVVVPAEGLSLRDLASKLSMKVTELRNRLEELGETLGEVCSS